MFLFSSVFIFSLQTSVYGQDSANVGTIIGKIKDSAFNFVLNSATVAVYNNDMDKKLIQYSLPNSFGEFSIVGLPVNRKLRMEISYIGYISVIKNFILTKEGNNRKDFGWIFMHQSDSNMASTDVIVTSVAPVRMNGDTVEFNADAFKLDSNATAEDLIRKLPGFTMWGDGDITFNGKKINKVFVNGKPFLGGTDISAATENLPKNALKKIQVYQQRNDKNPLDSTMYANLELKDDKSSGHFGKISGGYGTRKNYDADGMITAFNAKFQLSAAAAANNVNKIADSVDVLIKNAAFKGIGANTEYQPDFNTQGINKPINGGVKFQYDFNPNPSSMKTSRLNAEYFLNRQDKLTLNNNTVNTFLSQDSLISQISGSKDNNRTTSQLFDAHYQKSSPKMELNIISSVSMNNSHDALIDISRQLQSNIGTVSNGNSNIANDSSSKKITVSADYYHKQLDFLGQRGIPKEYDIKYSLSISNNDGSGTNKSDFNSIVNASTNQNFDRLYKNKNTNSIKQSVHFEYPRLKELLFGNRKLGGINIGVSNDLYLTHKSRNDAVSDLDTLTNIYRTNNYLTNTQDLNITDVRPTLTISRNFNRIITNRYLKELNFQLQLKEQFINWQNEGSQNFQDIQYNYKKFIPIASVNYHNHQFGDFEIYSDMNYETNATYPQIDQLAPLIDSTNFWSIPIGNKQLLPEYNKKLSLNFQITGRKPKNPFQLQLKAALTNTSEKISDSIIFNGVGQEVIYPVNLNGARNVTANLNYRKAFEGKNNNFQFQLNYDYSYFKSPGYINGTFNVSQSSNNNGSVSLDLSHKDLLTVRSEGGINFYNSKQNGFENSTFKNNNQFVRLSTAFQYPKNLLLNTNITFNRSVADNTSAINYTIWNASLAYRFLKGNRGEIKFSALDLLHQNKGLINMTKGITQTIGYTNVLQNYFMVGVSFYPRKFGKKP